MPVDRASLERVIGAFAQDRADALGVAFVERARGYCSRRTGALAESITAEPARVEGGSASVHVYVGAEYGAYQDRGTGIYGPTGQRITPTNPDGVLAFDWPAAGGLVFFKSVAGSPGTAFFTRTVEEFDAVVREAA